MPRYVDGFVIPIKRRNIPAYRRMAAAAAKVWMEYGAVEYCEAVGDDLEHRGDMGRSSFPKIAKAKPGETVLFSWILYKSRAQRNRVNAKVMKDPRIARMMESKEMPFDPKRMSMGGFKLIVDR